MSTKTIEKATDQRLQRMESQLEKAMKMINEYQESHENLRSANGELMLEIQTLRDEMDIREGQTEMERAENEIHHIWGVIRGMGGWLILEIVMFVLSIYMSLSDDGAPRMVGIVMAMVVFIVFIAHFVYTYKKLRAVEKQSIMTRAHASHKLQRGYTSKAEKQKRFIKSASSPT